MKRSFFRVLTFNIQAGQIWDAERPDEAPFKITDTLDFLCSRSADAILLQEVELPRENGEQPFPGPNYAKLKEGLPGYASVFAYPRPHPDELPFGYGLAIFARDTLWGFERIDLPSSGLKIPFDGRDRASTDRILIGAKTSVNGRVVQLLNTHLQALFMIGATTEDYRGQRDIVERRLREANGTPTILGGDFNCAPGENVVAQFADAGFSTVQNARPTWKRRPYVLDHLFYNSPLRLVEHTVLNTPCSDHDAVEAVFELV